MSNPHALFPGTFDPPTRGHVDLVRRAAALFERVTVAVADHPTKSPIFAVDERLRLLGESLEGIEGVSIARVDSLVVQTCERLGCDVVVRGARSGSEYDYEREMACMNRRMLPRLDTVVLAPDPELAHVSSTLVRQIAALGGDPGPFVPAPVAVALRERFGPPTTS